MIPLRRREVPEALEDVLGKERSAPCVEYAGEFDRMDSREQGQSHAENADLIHVNLLPTELIWVRFYSIPQLKKESFATPSYPRIRSIY